MSELQNKVFNQDTLIEGWYWVCKTADLKKKRAMKFKLLEKDVVVFRTASGALVCLDAFCPHMGAHLGEGNVEGESIRCLFHNWKFGKTGQCTDIPCADAKVLVKPTTQAWPVAEHYGLIWIYAGREVQAPLPIVEELTGCEVNVRYGNQFEKPCHPNVVMVNAIDEQHFASVHPMAGGLASDLSFAVDSSQRHVIRFYNHKPVPKLNWITRFIAKFYKDKLTYNMSYWFGNTGTVTLGPDLFHFHIMFALRPTAEGHAAGQTILVTKKRPGFSGKVFNSIVLLLTDIVGRYFAEGDTKIFRSIRFQLATPTKKDRSIISFVEHTERQKISEWALGPNLKSSQPDAVGRFAPMPAKGADSLTLNRQGHI